MLSGASFRRKVPSDSPQETGVLRNAQKIQHTQVTCVAPLLCLSAWPVLFSHRSSLNSAAVPLSLPPPLLLLALSLLDTPFLLFSILLDFFDVLKCRGFVLLSSEFAPSLALDVFLRFM